MKIPCEICKIHKVLKIAAFFYRAGNGHMAYTCRCKQHRITYEKPCWFRISKKEYLIGSVMGS